MKKTIFIVIFSFLFFKSHSQDVPDNESIEQKLYARCFSNLKPLESIKNTNWKDENFCSLFSCIVLLKLNDENLKNELLNRIENIADQFFT